MIKKIGINLGIIICSFIFLALVFGAIMIIANNDISNGFEFGMLLTLAPFYLFLPLFYGIRGKQMD